MSSVAACKIPVIAGPPEGHTGGPPPPTSGGSVREERIIMHKASSSCKTLSRIESFSRAGTCKEFLDRHRFAYVYSSVGIFW
nr:unnamed protein product [Callosobruchus analis]